MSSIQPTNQKGDQKLVSVRNDPVSEPEHIAEDGNASTCLPADAFQRFSAKDLAARLLKQPPLRLKSRSIGSDNWTENFLHSRCKELPSKKTDNWWSHFCNRYLNAGEASATYSNVYTNEHFSLQSFLKLGSVEVLSVSPLILDVFRTDLQDSDVGTPLSVVYVKDAQGSHPQSYLYPAADVPHKITNLMDYSESIHAISASLSYAPAIAYLLQYRDTFEKASAILALSHPKIHPDNLKLMLATHFVHELVAIDYLDAWQDVSLCNKLDCGMKNKFVEKFPELNSAAALKLWEFTTKMSGNMLQQGFGPGQTILGLALEAASYKSVAKRYTEFLSEEELTTEEGAQRAILDPQKAIYYRALVYDFLLTLLEQSLFYSPQVTAPSDRYPFPAEYNTARELALIEVVQQLSVYPENHLKIIETMVHGSSSIYLAELFFVGEMLEMAPHLPGLELFKKKVSAVSHINLGLGTATPQPLEKTFPIEMRFVLSGDRCFKDAAPEKH